MSATWTYWRVHAPADEADHLIGRLRDLVDTVVGPEPNWHFLRYVDHRGPHVRFRVFSESRLADQLHAARLELGHPVQPDLYEPEIGKWGTEGVRDAERVFTASTNLAVAAIRAQHRAHVAQDVFAHTVEQLVPDVSTRLAVARTHAAWWLGDHSPGGKRVDDALAATRTIGHRRITASTPSGHLTIFTAALGEAMSSAGTDHPVVYHLHQHLHLTMNRLGLDPAGEAQVAVRELARLEATQGDSR